MRFKDWDQKDLRFQLEHLTNQYFDPDAKNALHFNQVKDIQKTIGVLDANKKAYELSQADNAKLTPTEVGQYMEYVAAIDSLISWGIVNSEFWELKTSDLIDSVSHLATEWQKGLASEKIQNYSLQQYVKASEALQMKAPWTGSTLQWVSLGILRNVSPYEILDPTAPSKDYKWWPTTIIGVYRPHTIG